MGKKEKQPKAAPVSAGQKQSPGTMRRAAAFLMIGLGLMLVTALGIILLGLVLIAPAAAGSEPIQEGSRAPGPAEIAAHARALYPQSEVHQLDLEQGIVQLRDGVTGEIGVITLGGLGFGQGTAAIPRPSPTAPGEAKLAEDKADSTASGSSQADLGPGSDTAAVPLALSRQRPPDIPKWIPLVDGVQVQPTVKTNEGGSASGLFSFTIRAAVRNLADFYKRTLKEQGVPILEKVQEEGGQPVMAQLNARGERKVQIQIAREGESSRVTVAYSVP